MGIQRFYIEPDVPGDGIERFYIEPAVYPAFYINPEESQEPEGEIYEWRIIGSYTFVGSACSPDFNATPGNYTAVAGSITTNAVRVRIVGTSGYWYDGTYYRGTMDVKTALQHIHFPNDWTGSYYGFTTSAPAAAHWLANADREFDIGPDRKLAWGGQDLTPDNNSGSLRFNIFGKFLK